MVIEFRFQFGISNKLTMVTEIATKQKARLLIRILLNGMSTKFYTPANFIPPQNKTNFWYMYARVAEASL